MYGLVFPVKYFYYNCTVLSCTNQIIVQKKHAYKCAISEPGICCLLHLSDWKCLVTLVGWVGITEHYVQWELNCVYILGVIILLYISCEMKGYLYSLDRKDIF
jgi:hypothetical protein